MKTNIRRLITAKWLETAFSARAMSSAALNEYQKASALRPARRLLENGERDGMPNRVDVFFFSAMACRGSREKHTISESPAHP